MSDEKSKGISKFQKKNAICIVGRFQPFSNGHLRLVREAKKEFLKGNYDKIYIVIIEGRKSSEDKERNPLSGQDRKKYIQSISGMEAIKVIITSDVLSGFYAIREDGFEPKTVVGGAGDTDTGEENTASTYKRMLDKYFKNGDDAVRHKMVIVKRDKDNSDNTGISGTMARNAATAGNFEVFKKCVPFSEEISKEIFDKIRGEK